MNDNTSRFIPTEDLAEAIIEELDDLYHQGLISSPTYRKKISYVRLMKAINEADRVISRNMRLKGMVVVYAPPDQNNIIFADNHRYVKDYRDSIQTLTDLSTTNKQFFLGDDKFLDVIEITDTYIYKFDEYPASGELSESRLKKVGSNEFYSREEELRNMQSTYFPTQYYEDRNAVETLCYFKPDEQRLVMDAKFSSGAFLQFEGRLMPGLLTSSKLTESDKANEDWKAYSIKAPHWAYETLKWEALLSLMPIGSSAYNAIEAKKQRVERDMQNSKPSNSTMITPLHSY